MLRSACPREGVRHAGNELVAHGDVEYGIGRNDGVEARRTVQQLVVGDGEGRKLVLDALLALQGIVDTRTPRDTSEESCIPIIF